MRLYGVESRRISGAYRDDTEQYRFYSLYNSARGSWNYKKEDAIEEGEMHQVIIQHHLQIDFRDINFPIKDGKCTCGQSWVNHDSRLCEIWHKGANIKQTKPKEIKPNAYDNDGNPIKYGLE